MRLNGLQLQPEPLIRGEFLIGGDQRAFRFNGRHQDNAVVGVGMPFFVDGQEWELLNLVKHLCRRKEHGNPVFLKIIHNLYYRGVQFHLAKLLQGGYLHQADVAHSKGFFVILQLFTQILWKRTTVGQQPNQSLCVEQISHNPVLNGSETNGLYETPGMKDLSFFRLMADFLTAFLLPLLAFFLVSITIYAFI